MAERSLENITQEISKSVEVTESGIDQGEKNEIERLAHQLWLERGSPIGSPEEDWFRAEAKVRSRQSKPEQAANAA